MAGSIKCAMCGTDKPDGVRWIPVARGWQFVCSVECQERRLRIFEDFVRQKFWEDTDDQTKPEAT